MNAFVRAFAERLAGVVDLPPEEVAEQIGAPPRPELGHLAYPCFGLAKLRREAPPKIAADVAASLEAGGLIQAVTAAGPYVNATLDGAAAAAAVLPLVKEQGEAFGRVDVGHGGVVPVDFSSPNIAKSFGVHHLRSTVIGHALVRMLEAAGYRPVSVNHLGDWGTQFGQLLAMWDDGGDDAALEARGIKYLLELYVGFNALKEQDPSVQERARARFKDLEDGDAEARALWKRFRDASMEEFHRVYAMLGIRFDDERGESFYEDRMPAVLADLEAKGLLRQSESATIVDLETWDLGAGLVKKGDGSTLYLTRDLAAARFRHEEYGFVRSLYVVGAAQSLHFKQMKKILELLGDDWQEAVEHVPFGLMRFKDRKMSTRKGDIIPLEEVLDRAVALARETIVQGAQEKGRELPADLDDQAHQIGVGAVVFNDLKNRRMRDVVFDWDEVLNNKGETGPYLQYTAARIGSMAEKAGRTPPAEIDWSLLDGPGETALVLALAGLPDSLERGVRECEPSLVADRLLEIASRFSTLYSDSSWKVLSDDESLSDARLTLALATRQALVNGLGWLGISAPSTM